MIHLGDKEWREIQADLESERRRLRTTLLCLFLAWVAAVIALVRWFR